MLAVLAALGQVSPAGFGNLHIEVLRRGQDALPRLVPLRIADAFDLVETGDGIAHVPGVGQRLLAFGGKGELLVVQPVLLSRAHALAAAGDVLAVSSGALCLPRLADVTPGGFLLFLGGHDASSRSLKAGY